MAKKNKELTVEDVSFDKLKAMVKKLNNAEDLLDEPIAIKGREKEEVFEDFMDTVSSIPDKKEDDIPEEVTAFYNKILKGDKSGISDEEEEEEKPKKKSSKKDDDEDDDEDEKPKKKPAKKSKDDDDDEEDEKPKKKPSKKSKDEDDDEEEEEKPKKKKRPRDDDDEDDDEDEKPKKKPSKKSEDEDDDEDDEEEKPKKKSSKKDDDEDDDEDEKPKKKDKGEKKEKKLNPFGFKEGSAKSYISNLFIDEGIGIHEAAKKVEKKLEKEGFAAYASVLGMVKRLIKRGHKVDFTIVAKPKKK